MMSRADSWLITCTTELIVSTLLDSHTILQKIGHVRIIDENSAAVWHMRDIACGYKPPQAGIAEFQPFASSAADGCGQTDKIAVVVFHRCFLLKIFVV